jgi:hypothetical protein
MISQITPAGLNPRHACQVDRRLGVTCAHENAAVARNERENVTRASDIGFTRSRIDGDFDGVRPVCRRDTGRNALAGLD